MTEQEQRVLDYLTKRYAEKLDEFKRARRFSPCTKDYVHGRLTEIREILIALYDDEGRKAIEKIDNQ